jgi:rhomboid family protein
MSSNGFLNSIPRVTRNLLFINIILFMVQQLVAQRGGDVLADLFGLHFFLAPDFRLWQVVTYMFLHGSWSHVLLNMFSLWMFGRIIEQTMGQRRFLIYYFICGVGAALCQELWQLGQYYIEGLNRYTMVSDGVNTISMSTYLNSWVTIGASGACYGVLLAFGMTFPEERIMLLFPPIPMKAKYFVVGYALIEVFSAFYSNGNIAHFAHLGGMFFGWLYFRSWRRKIMAAQNRGHYDPYTR